MKTTKSVAVSIIYVIEVIKEDDPRPNYITWNYKSYSKSKGKTPCHTQEILYSKRFNTYGEAFDFYEKNILGDIRGDNIEIITIEYKQQFKIIEQNKTIEQNNLDDSI